MVKVSALVSAYFDHEFLDGRIVNLKAQMDDIQIVVVCRCGSLEYQIAKDHGVDIVTTQDTPTIGSAWNVAIAHSCGEYLTTANCDDQLYPGGLQTMVDIMDNKPEIGLVFARCDRLINDKIVPWHRYRAQTGRMQDPLREIKKRCLIGAMPVWRSALHENFGMFNEHYQVVADWDMWLYMAAADVGFYYIEEPLGIYNVRDNSLEHRNRPALRAENEEIRLKCA